MMPRTAAAIVIAFACLAAPLHAQWTTTVYTLRPGWNSLWLHGDASHLTPDQAFASVPQVTEIWRWNNGAIGRQFSFDPATPGGGLPDWSYWAKGAPGNTLASMIGQAGYLVHSTASSNITVSITSRAMAPANLWTRSGANFQGLPSRSTSGIYPTFAGYFASFPAAISTGSGIFKYIGGSLSQANPMAIFSTTSERVDRNQAYWFEAEVTSDFYGPFSISFKNGADLAFGLQRNTSTLLLRNLTANQITVTATPVSSVAAPAGQPAVAGPASLTRRSFDPSTGTWSEAPLGASTSISIPGNSTVELPLGLARSGIQPGDFHTSILRLTDSLNLAQIDLPVSATGDSKAGLWVGEATLTGVGSFAAGYSGTATSPTAPSLRILLHISADGSAKLLSQAFLGLDANDIATITTSQSLLKTSALAEATRFFAAHMPLDRVILCSGSANPGSSLSGQILIPFDDATNPLVHQYHPDHDNRSPTGVLLSAGTESANISRAFTLAFTADAPGTSPGSGWGGNAIGGTYSETLTGLSRQPVTITGTFRLQKASSISSLAQ
jgi:hypothetical protein